MMLLEMNLVHDSLALVGCIILIPMASERMLLPAPTAREY